MELGSTIRRIRKEKLLTLKDVAHMTNLTESLLSQIENNKAQPSIASLMAISKALNTPIAFFFEQDESHTASPVLRSSERPVVHTISGITYYLLTQNVEEVQIEMLYAEYEPGSSTEVMHTHVGYECGIVLEGKLEVILNEDRYVLNRGDSITIPSSQPHNVINIYDGTTSAIWVNNPPTF
ncbi:MAG: helix-turn-helix transcriptional regulator [Spirochaetaceae bacterium]|nr:MAG: helix-turn-helix transcriptional regulator [Spirochaetaceae bacterium]